MKTAWAGADPNWGRILAAIGEAEVAVDISKVDINFGELPICRGGMAVQFDGTAAHAYLSQGEFEIIIQLNHGSPAKSSI